MEGAVEPVIRVENLGKTYEGRVQALRGVSFEIHPGETLAIMGQSGSGKSTLLNLLGCLDTASEGAYFFRGEDVNSFSDDQLSLFRNRHIGFVFQSFNLIPQFTVLENVEVPLFYRGVSRALRRERARELVERVGLADRSHHRSAQLSGGEMQRVAIARALVNDPDVLIADEPTGNLDTQTGAEIMDIIAALNRDQGTTVILVTHDAELGAGMGGRIELKDGKIVSKA